MTPFHWAVLAAVCFGVSLLSTRALVGLLTRARVMDTPSHRTLHQGEVPRGGGIAIVLVGAAVPIGALAAFPGRWQTAAAMVVTLVCFGAIGALDDRRGLSTTSRFVGYTLVAVAAVAMTGLPDTVRFAGLALEAPGPVMAIAAVLWVLWFANLYNFMDGIDGIAASQAVIAGMVLGSWFATRGAMVPAAACVAIASASAGFLVWNWQPARIFLGDAGSVALGGFFGVSALVGVARHDVPLSSIILLFAVFLTDTTVTLICRLLKGENIFSAHREHYYQVAVQSGASHAQVTLACSLLSVLLAGIATLDFLGVGKEPLWLVAGGVLLLAAIGVVRNLARSSHV